MIIVKLIAIAFLTVAFALANSQVADLKSILEARPRSRSPLMDSPRAGDPVDLQTGLYVRSNTDLYLKDSIPIQFSRTYRNADSRSRAFGIGTSLSFDMFIVGDSTKFTYVELVRPDGGRMHYDRISPGQDFATATFEHTSTPTVFYRSRITWNGKGWTVTLQNGSTYKLRGCNGNSKPGQCGLIEFRNSKGEVLQVQRELNGNVSRIVSPHGKWVALTYDSQDRIIRAADSLGRSVVYKYDPEGRLVKVLTSSKEKFRYQYDSDNRMTGAWEGNNRLLNTYDGERCVHQTWWKSGVPHVFSIKYSLDERGKIREADVTEPDNSLTRTKFDANGYTEVKIYHVGQPNQITVSYNRDSKTNNLKDVTVTCAGENRTRRIRTPIGPARSGEGETNSMMAWCAKQAQGEH